MTTHIGRKVRELRLAQGLSLVDLAEKAGVSKSFVSEVERGNRAQPRKDSVLALARAFNVDPAYLMDDSAESVFTVFKATGSDMPTDIREFLEKESTAFAWVRLAAKLDSEAITPQTIEALVAALRNVAKE